MLTWSCSESEWIRTSQKKRRAEKKVAWTSVLKISSETGTNGSKIAKGLLKSRSKTRS